MPLTERKKTQIPLQKPLPITPKAEIKNIISEASQDIIRDIDIDIEKLEKNKRDVENMIFRCEKERLIKQYKEKIVKGNSMSWPFNRELCDSCGNEPNRIPKKYICPSCGFKFCSKCFDQYSFSNCTLCGKKICEHCTNKELLNLFANHEEEIQINQFSICLDCANRLLEKEKSIFEDMRIFLKCLKKKR